MDLKIRFIVIYICTLGAIGCSIFDNEDECSGDWTGCKGNILEVCAGGESGTTDVFSLFKTDCSEYGAVCLYNGSFHGCYYTHVVCKEDMTSMCIGNVIGDCDHNGSFCPNAAQDTDVEQNCEDADKVKYPGISSRDPCDNSKGEYCRESTILPTTAGCTYWPEPCDPELDTESKCNSTLKNDSTFICIDGIWGSTTCGDMICCETSTGAECMETCVK